MVASKNTRKKKLLVAITVPLAVILLLVLVCAIYLGDYYRADLDAVETFMPEKSFSVKTLADDTVVFAPEDATVGLIFYPGGKVEHTAYIPLMEACASRGILCVLVEMPFCLAVFDINAAEGIQEKYPEVESWYIGGHSLGGSMAASYLADHIEDFEGLILLGSYSTADLSSSNLRVLSVYGSEDEVLNREKYEKNLEKLPEDFRETVIEGGCHAYFGMYGEQEGDGSPTLSPKEQILLTAEEIASLVFGD